MVLMCTMAIWGWGWHVPPASELSLTQMPSGITRRSILPNLNNLLTYVIVMSTNFILINTVRVFVFSFKGSFNYFVMSCRSARILINTVRNFFFLLRVASIVLLSPVEVPGKLFLTTLVSVLCVRKNRKVAPFLVKSCGSTRHKLCSSQHLLLFYI